VICAGTGSRCRRVREGSQGRHQLHLDQAVTKDLIDIQSAIEAVSTYHQLS
jgi:hypothetical protein